jgi:hypothetical protein
MSPQRQQELDRILHALRQIQGVSEVTTDDFTDEGFWVFLELIPKHPHHSRRDPVYEFAQPLRSIKGAIRRSCRWHGVSFDFRDWPTRQYDRSQGERYYRGYDKTSIKLDLQIPEYYPDPKPAASPKPPPIKLDDDGRPVPNWGH